MDFSAEGEEGSWPSLVVENGNVRKEKWFSSLDLS